MNKAVRRLISSVLTTALLIAAICPAVAFRSYAYAAEAPSAVTGLSIQVTSSPSAKLPGTRRTATASKSTVTAGPSPGPGL